MTPPQASIIMPAYNVAPWIGQALDSVLRQTVSDWECIVINDGSSDNTSAVVSSIKDSRIKLLQQENAGVAAARNKGLGVARGRYITFLDADDIWHPNALERLCAALDANPACDLCWGDFVRFDDDTKVIMPLPGTRLWHTGNVWADILVDCFIQFGAFCARAEAAAGLQFNTSLRICEDKDWLLRLLRSRTSVHTPHVVHFYRQRANSAIRDYGRFLDDEEAMLKSHLERGNISDRLKKRVSSALQFHRAVLLAKIPGRRMEALRAYVKALLLDPLYCDNYFKPLRKLFFSTCRLVIRRRALSLNGNAS